MSDQCKHCSVIFNEKACDSTQCSIHESTYAWRLKATIERQQEEIERLQAIVDALTLTEDGVRVHQGMRLYKLMPDKNEIFIILANPGYINCFSTSEAAEAAKEAK